MLANLVNGLCALASGANIFAGRQKENTLASKLSDGRVSFEDALSHIYPETSKRAQPGRLTDGVTVESVTIYEAYKGLSQARSFESLPAALESLNQGQINSASDLLDVPDEEFQSQIDTYDNLPAQTYQDLSVQNAESQPVEPSCDSKLDCAPVASYTDTFENLTRVQAELAQQILVNYAETVSPVRRDFLENMTSASAQFLAARHRPAQPVYVPTSMSTSMSQLVDRIFNTLEPYIHELNQTFRATDLSITFTPPSVVSENYTSDTSRRPSVVVSSYRCRISTSCLALVIRGKEDRIDFFVLPVERVMGLSKTEDQHEPLMTFTASAQSGAIYWDVEQKPLTEERLEKYILLVFEHLLDLTREELLRRPALALAF
ncbi:MAG: hypothetical protein IT342_00440 [Candidatus Melainabacteria bacterium]|nr:hypothetical protein [Candidatus Melainabacteria bacterium]